MNLGWSIYMNVLLKRRTIVFGSHVMTHYFCYWKCAFSVKNQFSSNGNSLNVTYQDKSVSFEDF